MRDGPIGTWFVAVGVSLLLVATSLLFRRWRHRPVSVLAREAGIVSLIFLLWQLPTRAVNPGSWHLAMDRARWIHRWEHVAGLPDEVAWQHAVLPYGWLVEVANGYYAVMHFGVMAAFLVWLLWRHRSAYPQVRTAMVLVTGVSLLVQRVAVAPPRLLPRLGFVDTAARYGQSVYHSGPGRTFADELSAVPSVHIVWALLVCGAVLRIGRGRARWLILAHPPLTLLVVVVTANHFWFDAGVAFVVVGFCVLVQWAGQRLMLRLGSAHPRAARVAATATDRVGRSAPSDGSGTSAERRRP